MSQAQRFNALACGRRWGKSTLAVDLLLRAALPGQPAGYFAPTYKLLTETWRNVYAVAAPVIARLNASERRMELIGGGVLEFWTLQDKDAGRSRRYQRVIVDEAGLVPDLGAVWAAAIRPTLADFQGDAWFLGTPKGHNFFWQAYQWGQDTAYPDWASWQRPTEDNPHIAPAEIVAMRQSLPERIAAQEIDAAFLADGGGVFRNVRGAVGDGAHSGPYVVGIDWGRANDFTVLAVVDYTQRRLVHLDRFTGLPYAAQIGRVTALVARFAPEVIVAETNAMGGPLVEELYYQHNLPIRPFATTHASKVRLIDALALAFERGQVTILDDPALIGELEAFEVQRTSLLGLPTYGAPEGMHDDTVMALALAWSGAQWAGGWTDD